MNKKFGKSIIINNVTYSIIVILSYLIGISRNIIYYISITYYIINSCYKMISLIPYKNTKSMQFQVYDIGILLHNIIIIYTIRYITDNMIGALIFYWLYLIEISNLPIYAVQYFIKMKYKNMNVINLLMVFIVSTYIYINLYLCSYLIYLLLLESTTPILIIVVIPLIIIINGISIYKLIKKS